MHDWSQAEISTVPSPARTAAEARKTRPPGPIRRDCLAEILKEEFLPRLIADEVSTRGRALAIPRCDPGGLARKLLAGRYGAARAAVEARLEAGATLQSVMLEDLGPAARRLGDYWRDDECDFVEVTIATRALGDMMRDFAPQTSAASVAASIIISTAPGETHAFGADVVAALFRLAGWRAARCEWDEARARLIHEAFDIAAFSINCDRHLALLPAAIREARAISRNRRIAILVGGSVVGSRPRLAQRIGADFRAPDGDITSQFPRAILREIRL